ncbi:glucose-1-phosphate cytidylyltransferase [Desulfoluna butyratoxydans]|uniref:Nucleotide-diphospho-sugar transferases n=1 Tax=Desulfoluna butyratoxydans TaxID=231438 RepID=A0A4U8YSD6_9BACT|nr:glucose-1-phosphate cytidylyltransferase [Desulfoluna butyratoxydans]VFQ47295.1 nucleotide-diphospho-sugar transferases [Desulfoluna butyratoxydans]
MKAVILAGGYGTRLSEETEVKPKPMVRIGGRPILWHIMKIYSAHGINDFIICLGYKGYVIKEYFANYFLHMSDVTFNMANNEMEVIQKNVEPWRVTLVDTGNGTMTGGRLKRVAKYLGDETFCLTYGDGVGNIDITEALAFHRNHGRKATMTAVMPPARFGALEVAGNRITNFSEKPQSSESRINGGFFILEPAVIDYIQGDSTSWEKEPLEQLARAGQLEAYFHNDFWQPMDTLRDKKRLMDLWDAGNAPWKVW